MLRNPAEKYRPLPAVPLKGRRWPTRTIDRAPIWMSTDLRDGNQSLIEPMSIEQKLEFFEMLVAIGFSVLVVVGLSWWARKSTKLLPALGMGMIIGAAIGNNLIDRVLYGYVVDFIDVSRLNFPWVFNVADSGINIGVALLLIDSFLYGEKKLADPAE